MTDKQLETSTLLIEIDALLDTRLATIASLGDDVLAAAYTPLYHQRICDRWSGVNPSVWQGKYDKRGRSILKEALLTPMGQFLNEFTFCTLKQIINTPFHYQPKILLNVYPYQLTEDEINILIQSVMALTDRKADVQAMNVSYEQITPAYVKKHINIMVMYEYYKWLEIHALNGKLKKITCPEVALVGPAIFFKPVDSSKSSEELVEALDAIQQLTAPLIGLQLLPIENFSIVFKPT